MANGFELLTIAPAFNYIKTFGLERLKISFRTIWIQRLNPCFGQGAANGKKNFEKKTKTLKSAFVH